MLIAFAEMLSQLVESVKKVIPFPLDLPRIHHLFALVCLIAFILKLTQLVIKRWQWIRHLEDFPGPPSHWLFGQMHKFKQDGTDLHMMLKWVEEFPCAFPMWFGPFVSFLHVHHPDYVKTILATAEPKDDLTYRFLIPWLGDGLLVSKGQKWSTHRKLITPAFHYEVLKPYVKLMSDSTKTMLDKWEGYANTNKSLELFEHVSLMTLDSIMKCAFSCNSNCQTGGETQTYINAVFELGSLAYLRFRKFPYHSDIIFHLSPHGFRYRHALKVAHSHTDEVIKRRKEALKDEKELGRIQAKRNADFLDILLCARDEQQQGLSDEAIRAEVDTFMFEGHDTTASGVSFALYALACNPEHQQLCRDEIIEALDGKDTMAWEHLSKIPYTTMCIKECLRLYPPVPGMSRKTTKPMTFFDGKTVPEGCIIATNVYGIHRNPSVWENPNVFDPLRFLPENSSNRSPHAFVPFSAGPRNCVGQNFAMNELKIAVAQTLRRYHLIEDPTFKPNLVTRLVLRSLNGIHIKLKPVELES